MELLHPAFGDALIVQFIVASLLTVIEQRLRAHAASLLAAASPSAAAPAAPIPTPSPPAAAAPVAREQQETLYSSELGKSEIEARLSRLESAKTFLSELEAKAENLENRKNLFDSITELEALKKLLPVSVDPVTRPQPTATPASQSSPEPAKVTQARALARAEEVANQLGVYRQSIREAVLSSWALDDAFEEASELAGSESNKCQAASLIENGIWLTAFGQMAMALIAALFLAFLILVMADLTQTLLDTATNTGVMADASQLRS